MSFQEHSYSLVYAPKWKYTNIGTYYGTVRFNDTVNGHNLEIEMHCFYQNTNLNYFVVLTTDDTCEKFDEEWIRDTVEKMYQFISQKRVIRLLDRDHQ